MKTYEAILHCISTRFTLFHLSSSKSYNPRSISTLAVESFFSDLSKFKFGGLGAPKTVDILKLISHVVHLNTTKHDPKRVLNSQPAPETIILYISWNILKMIPIQMNLRIIPLTNTGILRKKDQKVIGSHFPNQNRLPKVVTVYDNISKSMKQN